MKKIYGLGLCFLLFWQVGNAQIVMSERIQYSQLANADDKKLFLIDFWATWCGPCITVSKYLNVLQEKFPSEFYVLSLTEENSEVVKKFLQRHPTKLAVSLDYDGQNFKRHKIKALPRGVLLNANGEVIWTGNPADLKASQIERFLKQNPKSIPIYSFLQYKAYETAVNQEVSIQGDYQLSVSNFEIEEMPSVEQTSEHLITIKGSLQQILAFLLNVSSSQIEIDKHLNQPYTLIINQNKDKNEIITQIKNQLGIASSEREKLGKMFEVTLISYQQLWDKKQVNWGFPNAKFLIDDTQITADNLSVREVLGLVSQLHKTPIRLMNQSKYINNEPYDWQIHYRFYDLLIDSLEDYGFKVAPKEATFSVYEFKKL